MASKREVEAELPIDIHSDKLLDWLTSRKKIPAKWQDAVRIVRSKLDAALLQLPAVDEVTSICSNTYINYYHCEQIFALLEKAEAEQQAGGGKSLKSFFGRYNSSLLAAWDDILQTYRKESMYLAEAARIMVQNVQYEIPTMKKSLAESERTIVELNRKRVTFERSAETFAAKFEAACAKLNISSASSSSSAVGDLRAEIERSGRELEAAIDAVQRRVAASALLAESADFYETFVRFQLRASLGDKKQYDESALPSLVPALRAVYAFDASAATAAAQMQASGSDDEFVSIDHAMVEHANRDSSDGASAPVINLDLDLDVDASAGQTDGDSGAAVDLDLGGDWGLSASGGDATDGQTGDDAATAPAISWDIDCVEIEAGSGAEGAPPAISWDLDDAGAGADGGEDDAIGGGFSMSSSSSSSKANPKRIGGSLLEAETRHAFTSDLLELEAFFQTRMTELTAAAADGMHMPPLPGAPAVLTRESADSCRATLACVADLLAAVRDPALVQLIMIRSSPKFVDRLVNSLEQQRSYVTKMTNNSNALESRVEENMATVRTTHPLLQRMIAQTKELQRNVERSIAAQYEGRVVNIIGDINTI